MEMTVAEQKFARAALEVFKRYGVRKATMEEIAQEAGVSKPTLYATVKNKDAALGVAIRFAKGASLASAADAWAKVGGLKQLDVFFERVVLAGYDVLHGSPDAAAFETALGDASNSAIAATRQLEISAVTGIIAPYPVTECLGIDAAEFADFIVTSAMNAKRQASSRGELEHYLHVLKASVSALLA